MRLLLDEMLHSAAILLRIYGVDTDYFHPRTDNELMEKARAENRVLVTRDKELYERCKANSLHCLLVDSTDPQEQVRQIRSCLNLELPFPEHTRCSICNIELKRISREEAAQRVPPDVLLRPGSFWACPGCNKAYWEGTHWKNITHIFNKITGKPE